MGRDCRASLRARRSLTQCNRITGVTSRHLCHIFLVRNKFPPTQFPTTLKGEGIPEKHEHQGTGITGTPEKVHPRHPKLVGHYYGRLRTYCVPVCGRFHTYDCISSNCFMGKLKLQPGNLPELTQLAGDTADLNPVLSAAPVLGLPLTSHSQSAPP